MLDLEGLWTRYESPEPLLAEITALDDATATRRLQELYAEPIKEELIGAPDQGDPRRGRDGGGAAVAAAYGAVPQGGRSTPVSTCS